LKIPSRELAKQRPSKTLRPLGTKSVSIEAREIVALKRLKELMKKNAGRLSFAGHGK